MNHSQGSDRSAEFSRAPNPERKYVEVRPLIPIEVCAIIDAVGMDEGKDRTRVVNDWLYEMAQRHHRRASLIVNASRGNPPLSPSFAEGSE